MTPSPPEVQDRASAVRFVQWCVKMLGLGYHPDTPFADYVDRDGRATFTPAEAARLEEAGEQAFAFCDPYEAGQQEFERLLAQDLRRSQTS
jgi:hypothetical protein